MVCPLSIMSKIMLICKNIHNRGQKAVTTFPWQVARHNWAAEFHPEPSCENIGKNKSSARDCCRLSGCSRLQWQCSSRILVLSARCCVKYRHRDWWCGHIYRHCEQVVKVVVICLPPLVGLLLMWLTVENNSSWFFNKHLMINQCWNERREYLKEFLLFYLK